MILKKKLWKQITAIIMVCILVIGTLGTDVVFAADNHENNITTVNLYENVDDKVNNEDSVVEDIKPEEKKSELDKILKECKKIKTDDKTSREIKRGQMVSVSNALINGYISMAIMINGDLYSWGYNNYGQVGNGTTENQLTPVKILKDVVSVSVSSVGTVAAITVNGDLYCWGYNENGQVGNGTIINQTTPVKILNNVKFVSVCDSLWCGGGGAVAAITVNGDLYCWGYNGYGQVGNGTINTQTTPVRILSNVAYIVHVSDHSFAATTIDGDLYCWGGNNCGVVGNGTTKNQLTPVKVLGNVDYVVTSNSSFISAITFNGDLYCWGNNSSGQVGNGTTNTQTTPVKILSNIRSVYISDYSSCTAAITVNGDLYCWGINESGQVGNGTTNTQTTPIKVLSNVISVSVFSSASLSANSYGTTIAITENKDLYCWGYNLTGQVGNGTTKTQTTPVKVLNNVMYAVGFDTHRSADSGFAAAILTNGDLYCWGYNYFGQVGNGTTNTQTIPTKVLSNVNSLYFCSHSHGNIGAITNDGELYCWGYNNSGQVGNGTTENQLTPFKVSFEDSSDGIASFTLSENANTTLKDNDNSFTFSGHIYLQEGKTASSEEWQSIVNSINWTSSDTSVVTDIKCQPVTNGNEQGDIEITVSVSLKSAGKATVTGTTSNGLTASCEVTVEDTSIISSFSLDSTKTGTLDNPFPVFGTLTFNNDVEVTKELIEKEINSINWTSSDQDILPDSAIKCSNSGISNSHSISLMLMITPKKEGKVTITGTASNRMAASCEIMVGGCIVINQKVSDLEGCTIALSGTLALEETTEASEANLQKAIDSLKFESSDDSKAMVLVCNAVKSKDYKSATLEIWTTLYNKGTATITVTAADGHKSKCEITIAENNSGDITNYEGDYTSKMSEFLSNKGTLNTLEYLCNDVNFTASTFVAEKDTQVGELIVKNITNTFYRGWDGWRDLIDGSTSVEEAEKIIASLLGAYQAKIKGLSEIKTAHKYAKMLNNAFSDYSHAVNLFKTMHSDEIEVVKKYFTESNLARLLYEGKYDEISAPVNQILQDEKIHQILQAGTQSEVFQQGSKATKSWNEMMEGFTKSGEVSKKLKEGCKAKLGKLEIGGGLNDIGKALDLVSFAQNTVNYLYQLESLLTADEMYCEMLLYVKENCVYDVVQKAAGNLYLVINDGVEGIISDVSEKAINAAGKEVFEKALNIACTKSLSFTIIKAGFDWGVSLSNTFFKTGKTQELKDSLRSQACLANCLGNWVQSNAKDYLSSIDTDHKMEKGKELYYSLYMLWEARKNAEETLQSLLKTTHAGLSANYSVSTKITSTLESFQQNIFTEENMESLLAISVSCPVDVEVYDEKGVKLLTVKDGTECQGYEKGIYYYCAYNPLAGDYDKYIYYSEDKNYNVKIVGNDLGLADCSVSRVDDNGYLSEFYFENKKIDKNTVIELYNISKEGVGYKVTDLNGSGISNSMESRKADKIATVSISLNTDSLELIAGNSQLLAVSFTPANAANQKVVWISDNDAVVSVNNDGVITAKTVGTAVVTVSQGDLEQKCKITVKKNPLQDNDNKNPSGSGTGGSAGSGGAGTTSTSAPVVTLTPSPSPTPVTIATTEPTHKPSASTKPGTGSDSISNNNSKKEITPADVTLNKKTVIYSGREKKPGVTVLSGSLELIKDKEYRVSYSYNINVGTAYVTVYGKGDYYGSVTKSFKIIPRGTPLKGKIKPRHKGFSVKWKKQPKSITGYQIQYSTDKKFKGKTTVIRTVKKKSVTKLTVSKLKAKKKYYVRVRTYKNVKGKKYYSRWSKSKVVKTKK